MIEKGVYSYWSKPFKERGGNGFNSEESFINCLKLSLFYSKKHFKEVELVTDDDGKKLLIDKYGLEFDTVKLDLNQLDHIKTSHWAIGKILACKIQKQPFLHIDNDVILFKKLPNSFLQSEASFQSKDWVGVNYMVKCILHFSNNFYTKKPKWGHDLDTGYNCGLIGFNRLDIINEWYDESIKYIDFYDEFMDNFKKSQQSILEQFKKLIFTFVPSYGQQSGNLLKTKALNYYGDNYYNNGSTCLYFEQCYVQKMCKHYGYGVKLLTDYGEDGCVWFSDELAEKLGYTHLIGGTKKITEIEEGIKILLDEIKYTNL